MDKNPHAGLPALLTPESSVVLPLEAHEMGVRPMVQAGVTPVTWVAVVAEWQRDWGKRPERLGALNQCLRRYGGAFGTAMDWEAQLIRAAG